MAVQLRRYEVEPGRLGELVEWFPKIVAVREQYGFSVEFAYADHENDQFVWAVSRPGSVEDYEAAMGPYETSPERAAAFEQINSPVKGMTIAFVDSAL